MEGTINLEKIGTDAQKLELKFGKVEFSDKQGNRTDGVNKKLLFGRSGSKSKSKIGKSGKTHRDGPGAESNVNEDFYPEV